jgi:hypothetical protein
MPTLHELMAQHKGIDKKTGRIYMKKRMTASQKMALRKNIKIAQRKAHSSSAMAKRARTMAKTLRTGRTKFGRKVRLNRAA